MSSGCEKVFYEHCQFGTGANKTAKEMDSSKFKKMMTDAKLFNKGKLNGAEVDMIFTKCKNAQKKMTWDKFQSVALGAVAKAAFGEDNEDNKKKVSEAIEKNPPQTNTKATVSKDAVVDRMTDASKYTGAHKERFDKDGKGKGIEGRKDVAANDGYVGNYKNKDTYDKKH